MNVVHVAVIMDSQKWVPNVTQFRYYGCTPWTEDTTPTVDSDFLHAMVRLSIATGARLQGNLFTVIRMVMDAHVCKSGSVINSHDFGPMIFVTDDTVNSRPKFERYLDVKSHQDLVLARKVGLDMHKSIKRATNQPL